MKLFRSRNEPIRGDLSFQERWKQVDKGLILSWEIGRQRRERILRDFDGYFELYDPQEGENLEDRYFSEENLLARIEALQLPCLNLKGGYTIAATKEGKVPAPPKFKSKYGSFNYLAQLQGLKGQDLEIYTEIDKHAVCRKYGFTTVFTSDLKRLG